ncbi:MAG: hypothetical protein MMC23_004064 [Stictis urceolatum]|nr:hypothetical protein [Stictis urceolata]
MATSRTHNTLTLKKVDGKPGRVWYPLQIQEAPTPSPSANQLLLRPTHLSLNHRDIFLRQHLYPSPSFTTPLLADAVCTVLSPSPSSSVPSRVILNPGHGWKSSPLGSEKPYAILGGTGLNPLGTAQDVLVVDKDEVVACPSHLTGAEAAALPLTGLTGWRALVSKAGITPENAKGQNLLITGIGGGVALCVLQFAVAMGARVWITSGSPEKIEKAKALGAQGGVSYKGKTWEKELKAMLPKDRPFLDAVVDGAGGDMVGRVVKIMKLGGVVVSYGMTTGPMLPVPMSAVLMNVDIRGSTMGSRREFQDMVRFVEEKRIRPVVSRVVSGKLGDLERWEGMFDELKAGKQFGKMVYELQDAGSKL